jgi:hypothetical protein
MHLETCRSRISLPHGGLPGALEMIDEYARERRVLGRCKIEEMHLHLKRIRCLAIGYILYLSGKAASKRDTVTYLAALVLIQKRGFTFDLSNIRFLL